MDAEVGSDLLRGTKAIARFTGLPPHQIVRLKSELPLFKIGKLWCMKKSAWIDYVDSKSNPKCDKVAISSATYR